MQTRVTRTSVVVASLLSLIAGCVPPVPAQATNITYVERVKQHFLLSGKSENQKAALFRFLVGYDASRFLATIQSEAASAAEGGAIQADGRLVLVARLDPFDTTSYTAGGFGSFTVSTTEPENRQVLFEAEFDIGNMDVHFLDDIRRLKQIVLPIVHSARLNPSLLFTRTTLSEEHCVIPVGPVAHRSVKDSIRCDAAGVGGSHQASYYVKVHLTEVIPGEVYAIDGAREHEVFRETSGKFEVFGCLQLENAHASTEVLDLRGQEIVKPLRRGKRFSPGVVAAYDRWNVPDACGPPDAALACSPPLK